MNLSPNERTVLELVILGHMTKGDERIYPEDIRTKFTPEVIQFTLSELETKGLVEYMSGGYTATKKAQELFKKTKTVKDEIIAWGHSEIEANDKIRIEITKGKNPETNSVIAVKANKSCSELNESIKDRLKLGKEIKIKISVGGVEDIITANGSPALEMIDKNSIVIDKTDFIDGKTLAIFSNKSASDLKKDLIEELKNPNNKIKIILEIK